MDLHSAIRGVLAMAEDEIAEKRLTVHLGLQAEAHSVVGDDVRLRQIFWNVLKNAVKFTPPGGAITVETETRSTNGNFIIRVIDTGIGMTEEEIGRIFDAFAQGNHTKQAGAHRFGGLGLGLAIARNLVELHQGSIHATSNGRGQGATFLIELPLPPAEARPLRRAHANGSSPGPSIESNSRRRVLLVEDHQPTSNALALLLGRRNYEVLCAVNIAEARAIAERENFDVLISDIGLPDGNGCDLMRELSGRAGLVGIALTGYGMEDDLRRSIAAGFRTHLTKPVRVQELDHALCSALSAMDRPPDP
jgi:CheY-like chemotaxis protein